MCIHTYTHTLKYSFKRYCHISPDWGCLLCPHRSQELADIPRFERNHPSLPKALSCSLRTSKGTLFFALLVQMMCVITLACCDQSLRSSALKVERSVWAHAFGGFNPWPLGPIVWGLWTHSDSWWEATVRKSVHLMKAKRRKEMGEAAPAYPHSLVSNGWHLLS